MKFEYNYLNLTARASDLSGNVQATYRWLSDGTKAGAKDAAGANGLEYLGSLVYARQNGTLTLKDAAFGGGRFVASTGTSGTTCAPVYHVTDYLGSTRLVLTAGGAILERNDYTQFGSKTSNSLITDNRIRFTGYEAQPLLGNTILDAGARFYNSFIFTTPDPMSEIDYPTSPYVYCRNNPVNRVDPNGMFSTKFGAWIYKIFHGGEILQDQGGEYFVSTESGYLTEDGVGIQASRRFDWSGRNTGKNMEHEASKKAFITQWNFARTLDKAGIEYNWTHDVNEARWSMLSFSSQFFLPNLLKAGTGVTNASKAGIKATTHGATRIAGTTATRGGVLSLEGVKATKSLGKIFHQADGATVYLHEVSPGKFNAVVEGKKGLITTMNNWSLNSINRIAKNYGWKLE